ncbi:MAG: cardiolipin synthase ClsB [Methylotenera sp.]|nr:cardiolipin synthase ClsB [Methylotenera sp.]
MTHFIQGNQIQLLFSGAEYFPALLKAIALAQHEIYLETYIFAEDTTGQAVANALKLAAQRGVYVHVLLDGFGCKNLSSTFITSLQQASVEVLIYRKKISPWSFKKNRLRRLHRKLVLIDQSIGFVGGINVIDDFNTPDQVPPRIDYAVRIEGALIPVITTSMQKLWRHIARLHLLPMPIKMQAPPIKASSDLAQPSVQAAFVVRDNLLHRHDIENAYLSAIHQANTEIIIANAYFLPSKSFRQALIAAAKRGVSVKLLLQGRQEYMLMLATYAFYPSFLQNKIEIYEYRHSFMHSKVAIVDREWATVGSSNIDPFSLLLAREANVVVKDVAFANTLLTHILHTIESAHRIDSQTWAHESLFKKISGWLTFNLVRVLLGIIGYGKSQ